MNKIISLVSFLFAVLLISCGEDRTVEYEELTAHNIWMYNQMKDKYLWADNLTEPTWKESFEKPADYFATLIKKGTNDYASYIVIDSINSDSHSRGYFKHNDSYGFDFTIINDPTESTSNKYFRIVTVYQDSPASKANLQRNDFIESFDEITKLTSNNADSLKSGVSRSLVVRTLAVDTVNQIYYWDSKRTVDLGASTYVEDKAFPACDTIIYNGNTVGYLMCNRLTDTEIEKGEDGKDYMAQMDEIMEDFRSMNVNQFVLDLRLCNFGTLEMACRLASYIVPATKPDTIFAKTIWNSKYEANNKTIGFVDSLKDYTLGVNRVAVLTSNYTQGAAEWVIKSLLHALGSDNVIIVGANTKGQNCIAEHIGDYSTGIHLYPAVAHVLSGDETEASTQAIKPTVSKDEFDDASLYEYGDRREVLFSAALQALCGNK